MVTNKKGTDAPLLSVITPAYNRAELLKKCYESLLRQSDKDFEWIIVDDGSKDNTLDVVKTFDTDGFDIVCVQKENGGKHTALNASHPFVRGKYVLILDSDDYLSDTAVEKVCRGWRKWENEESVGMLTFLKGKAESEPLCTAPIAETPVDILRYKRRVVHSSDCCEVIRTELFLKLPFPVFPGERFMGEGVLWNRVAITHKCVYINDVIYICEYLEDGLTKSGRAMRIRNPRGGMMAAEVDMQRKNYWYLRIKNGLLFTCYGFFAGMSPGKILGKTEYKGITALCLLPGYALHRYWKHKYMTD